MVSFWGLGLRSLGLGLLVGIQGLRLAVSYDLIMA